MNANGNAAPAPKAKKKGKKKNKEFKGTLIESFEELPLGPLKPELMRGIREMNWITPKQIQAAALPIILSPDRPNVIAQAKAGSGKTATFVLGALSAVDPSLQVPQALILATNLELSAQIAQVVERLSQFTAIKCFKCVKGCPKGDITAHVVVGTAGSVLNKLKLPKRQPFFRPNRLKVFILDEADEMIRMEDNPGSRSGLGCMRDQVLDIRDSLPRQLQVLLFSATFSKPVRKLAEEMAPNAQKLIVSDEHKLTVDTMAHFYLRTNPREKFEVLKSLYGVLSVGQMLVFVQRRHDAEWLDQQFRAADFQVSFTHGEMDAKLREDRFEDFKQGRSTVLITTNLFSRGIDISAITMVVNYDLPLKFKNRMQMQQDPRPEPDFDTFLHRVGRTARAGLSGIAIHFVDSEMNMQILKQIRERFALHMTELSFSHDPLQQQKLRSVVDKAFKQLKKKSDAQLAAEAEHGKAILQKEKARHDSEDRNKAALPESSAVPHRPPQNLPPPSSSSSSSSTSTLSSSPFGDTSAFGDGSSAFDEPIPNGDAVAGWREGGGDGDDVPDTGNADSGNAFGLEAGSGDGGGFGNFDFGSSEHGQEQGNSVGGLDDEDLGKGFGSMGIGGDKGDPISNWAAGFDNTAGSSDENVGGAVDFGDFAASFNADAFSSSQDFGNAGFDFAAELAGGGDSSKPES